MDEDEALPASPMSMQDGIRAVQQAFVQAAQPPRWPLYVRQAKQYLRSAIEGFDERKYGFASVVDLLRAAGKEGVLRIERDRQGAIRLFPGSNLTGRMASASGEPGNQALVDIDETVDVEVPADRISDAGFADETPSADAAAPGDDATTDEPQADEPQADEDRQPAFEMGPGGLDLDSDEPDESESQLAFNIQTSDIPREPVKSAGRKRKAPARSVRTTKSAKTAAPAARGRKTTRRKSS
jgi:hypothetical protein